MLGLGKDEVILYIVFSSILDALYRVFSYCSPLRVLDFIVNLIKVSKFPYSPALGLQKISF